MDAGAASVRTKIGEATEVRQIFAGFYRPAVKPLPARTRIPKFIERGRNLMNELRKAKGAGKLMVPVPLSI
jgi:hypothetical protein